MLLDTNAFLWFLSGDKRLRAPLRAAIGDASVPIKLSVASFWEITLKHRKGKLPMPAPFASDPALAMQAWCARAAIDLAPIDAQHVARAMLLDFANDDPFDRLIAATAIIENLELVTGDGRFADCPGLRVLKV